MAKPNLSLIEILQDGAAVVERPASSDDIAIVTCNVQTCLVTAYECEAATVLIHDSGQVRLDDIVGLVGQFGKIFRAWAAANPSSHTWRDHQRRTNRIRKILSIREFEQTDSPWMEFSAILPLGGHLRIHQGELDARLIPDAELRQAVLEVNNFFAPPRGESIPLDIQYRNGSYAPPMRVLYSTDELTETVLRQPDFFFQNLAFLHVGHDRGALTLPPVLLHWAKRLGMPHFRTSQISRSQLALQSEAFNEFKRTLTPP